MTLFPLIRRYWVDFLDGLMEVVVAVRARFWPDPEALARIDEGGLSIEIAGQVIGHIGFDGEPNPPAIVDQLSRHRVRIQIPPNWSLRKTLPSTTREGLAFLPAFVAYHIERITPWVIADVAYRIETTPVPADGDRVDVEILVVPKARLQSAIATVRRQPSATVMFDVDSEGRRYSITIDEAREDESQRLWRSRFAYGIAAFLAVFCLLAGDLIWEADRVSGEINDLEQQIRARQAMLVHLQSASTMSSTGAHLAPWPPRVRSLDDLARHLPDDAHLMSLAMKGDHLEISGLAMRTADLVPVLERTKLFNDVALAGAITTAEGGVGERFHLEMRIAPARAGP